MIVDVHTHTPQYRDAVPEDHAVINHAWRPDRAVRSSVSWQDHLDAQGPADVSIVFTTDPQNKREGFVLLEDDKGMFPPYNSMLVVRNDVIALLDGEGADEHQTLLRHRVPPGCPSVRVLRGSRWICAADFRVTRGCGGFRDGATPCTVRRSAR